ncbi:TPA: prepilin-type N-terminal cleavage/methylation domain-containing protein, partial [Vibrio cholerae O1]
MDFRRPILNVAFSPSVERRGAGVGNFPCTSRRSTFDTRPSEKKRSGMTLIELGIVMGIASVLLALVLGLARHVDASIKIRRAQ